MITVTPEAAEQIRLSAKQGQMEGMPLRIAVQRNADGALHYALGFADDEQDQDLHFKSEDIEIVVSPMSLELANNTVIDFVELDTGEKNFIFRNPNDPAYKPVNE